MTPASRLPSPGCLLSTCAYCRWAARLRTVRGCSRPSQPVALDSTRCYAGGMSGQPEITQRSLRIKSREIMDAVEHGQSFTVTRDGHRIGELIPLRRRRRLVSRQEFTAMSRNAPAVDL